MALATLTIDINARLANIERDLGRAAHLAEQSARRMGVAFAALGGVISAAAITGFVKSAIDAADELGKLSQKIGISVEDLAGFKHAADLSDLSLEQFAQGVKQLARYMGDNDDKLKAAGISATDATGALIQLSDAFAVMGDGPKKTAIAMELFGKAGADMIPLLNQGGAALRKMMEEGQRLNPVTTEMAKRAEEFNDNLTRLKAAASGAGIGIANDLLPPLVELSNRLRDAFSGGLVDGFTSRWGAAFRGLAAGINETMAASEEFLAKITFGRVAENHLKQALAYRDAAKKIYQELSSLAPVGGIQPDQKKPTATTANLSDLIGKSPKKERAARGTIDSFEDYADRINQAVAGAISGSAIVKSRELAAQIDALDKLFFVAGLDVEIYQSALDRLTGTTYAAGKESERLNELLAATPTAKIEEAQKDMLLLTEALKASIITEEQYLEAASTRLGLFKDDGVETFDELTKAIEGWSQRASDAFADFVSSGMKSFSDLGSFADSIMRQLISMTTNELLFKPMFNDLRGLMKPSGGSGGGNAWSWIKGLFDFADGGIMTSAGALPLQRYAGGGVATMPQLALFGEGAMNEAYVPLPDGRSIPVTMRGGGPTSIIVNVNSTTGDRAEIRRSAAAGARAALGVMNGARRYG